MVDDSSITAVKSALNAVASQKHSTEPQVTEASLISPLWDHFLIGGGSILAFFVYWLFVDTSSSVATVAEAAFWLSFVVNFPHFLSSYQLLYGDNGKHIFKKPTFFWAGVAAPALLIALLVVGTVTNNVPLLGLMAQGMFLSVGWHYMKQIFGTAVVASAAQKRYFGNWERVFILLSLYSLWGISFVSANLSRNKNSLDGLTYYSLSLPSYLLTVAYACAAVTFAAALFVCVRKYILTGVRPATSALLSFAAIYFWYIPSFSHPHFGYMIPFFHSLQYMLFVVGMKKNQAEFEGAKMASGPQRRALFLRKLWGFLILSAILGALSFHLIPLMLDRSTPLRPDIFGPTYWLFAFSVFLNLHHYFIDNVIWRGDNEHLRKHLVQASQARAGA
jgi:hypothetical protein